MTDAVLQDRESLLTLHDGDGYLHFDEKECRVAGEALATEYRSASPVPHIVIVGLISDPYFTGGGCI